jgi:hypothetical protein
MSTDDRPDDLKALASLALLAELDAPAELSDRVRRRARAELEASGPGRASWPAHAVRAWMRVGLPAALATTVVAYLSWAVTSASALYR